MSAADASGERPALTPEQRERSKQRRALLVAAVAAIVGAATVIVALVCLAVLALRLAGGAS